MRTKLFGFSLLLLALAAGASHAHEIWMTSQGDHWELAYGNNAPEPYDPQKVKDYRGYDKNGSSLGLKSLSLDQAFGVARNPKVAMITIVFDNGYWIQDGDDFKTVSAEEARQAPAYSHPWKYHKALYSWSKHFLQPAGLKMEIIPLQNPFTVKPGQTLPVEVNFDGKPLAGVDASYGVHGDQAPKVKTSPDGKAQIPIQKTGEQFIAADYVTPADQDPAKGKTSYSTSLGFELK